MKSGREVSNLFRRFRSISTSDGAVSHLDSRPRREGASVRCEHLLQMPLEPRLARDSPHSSLSQYSAEPIVPRGRWALDPTTLIWPPTALAFNCLKVLRTFDLAGVNIVRLATQRPVSACGGPLKMQGIMPVKRPTQSIFLNSVLNLAVKPEERNGRGLTL